MTKDTPDFKPAVLTEALAIAGLGLPGAKELATAPDLAAAAFAALAAPAAPAPAAAPAAAPAQATLTTPAAGPQPVRFNKEELLLPDSLLLSILHTKRAHGTTGDTNFRLWLHAELKKLGHLPTIVQEGSLVVTVGKKSTTLFSCHVDTCHGKAESNGSKQELSYDPSFGHIFLKNKLDSGCLGGDDGVGIYIMLKMIAKKVKGSYIFHTGEEVGGIGSRAMLKTNKAFLEGFDRCIAFDRAVRHGEQPEVILTQGGQACASIAFGNAVVAELNKHSFENDWKISHGGTFTDSKVYAGVIPECINLGAFYVNQHSPNEVVDAFGVEQLLAAACKIKWDSLVATRKPAEPVYENHYRGGYQGRSNKNLPSYFPRADSKNLGFDADDEDLFGANMGSYYKQERDFNPASKPGNAPMSLKDKLQEAQKATPRFRNTDKDGTMATVMGLTKLGIEELVSDEPEVAASAMVLMVARIRGLQAQLTALENFLGG